MGRALDESPYIAAALDALAHFPVEAGKPELVKISENVTFRIAARGVDTDYVLRLHRPDYNSIEALVSERIWTAALQDAGISVPGSLLTRRGEYFVPVEVPDSDTPCYAGMTTWIEGTPLGTWLETNGDIEERVHMFCRIGEIAAAIHNQAARWETPPGFERPRLDLDGLLGEAPRWGRFWEHPDLRGDEKDLLARARGELRESLLAYGESPGNFGLIHADLHPGNIIHTGDDLVVIDFDDSAFGWHLYEFAAALIEDRLSPGFGAEADAMIEGYRERRSLAARDVDMLPDFLLLRAMAIIGWLYQRPEYEATEFFEALKNWLIRECAARLA